MATQQVVNVYGFPPGWIGPTKKQFHRTTYIEYSIPKKLEKELTKLIDKRLSKFYRECKCEDCVERRKRKKMIQYGLISRVDSDTIEKTIDLICSEFQDEEINICEIGLYNGRTSAGLYEYVASKTKWIDVAERSHRWGGGKPYKCNYTGIESFILGEKMVFFPEDGRLINGNSIEVYNRIPDNSQHFILIDGNHSFPYVVADFFCYKEKIKKGGYICFHDASPQTQWKGWQHVGDKDDPDMSIAVIKALEKIGLIGENHNRQWLGFELVFHEWDVNDEGGGVIIFKKKY